MKKIVRLTENDLSRIVRRVIKEQNEDGNVFTSGGDGRWFDSDDMEIDDMPDNQGQMIDITKWETTKALIECILSENSIVDEAMGVTKLSNQLTIPFKISFNTLLKYNKFNSESQSC
jgi:hypothetical protein